MRKLMWISLGFGAACAFACYGLLANLFVPILAALVLAVFCTAAGVKWKTLRRPALVAMGVLLGLSWCRVYFGSYLGKAAALDGKAEAVCIRVTDYAHETAYGSAADGWILLDGKTVKLRAYLDEKRPLAPGDEIRGSFRFRLTAPGGAEEATYHAGKGIFLLAYQAGEVVVVKASQNSWRDFPAILRNRIEEILSACFPADTAPFTKALLLGDTTEISYETDTAFKLSGIRHVVAVSGLHVSILFALVSTVTFHKRFLTALVGFPVLLLFAAVAGFTPSVSRACIMAALMLLALLANREYDGATALSFAALVMLIANPLVITAIGFQLSAASVAGIYLFNAPIYSWLIGALQKKKKPGLALRWFCTSVSITLSAMTLTTPLCAYYFGTVSLVGVLTNLLTLWLVSIIFYGIMAVCVVSLASSGAAALLAKVISLPIRYILWTAGALAKFPLAAVYTRSPYVAAWLVFVYILLVIFVLEKNKKPLILSCCAVLGLCFALLASYAEPMLDDVRLTVLDVGQGQCLLLQSGGRAYMVDCGGGSDERSADIAAETLLSQGIYRLDGLILTHGDRDHAGGAGNLLSRVDVDLLIQPPMSNGLTTGGRTVYASQNLLLRYDDTTITVFAPQYPGTGNENSLCVLFESKKYVILITGDRDAFGERMLLRNERLPDVDVLIAGHHGSKYSTCDELLAAVNPEIVCISAGKDNPYGHPAPELLQRLSGREVYRTDQNGTILIKR